MAVNIEIKARVEDPIKLRKFLEAITEHPCEAIPQEDVFLGVPKGRLKLRVLTPGRSELIYYEREDIAGPKQSNYLIAPCTDPESLRTLLSTALGVRGIVKKQRLLYRRANTRIHLDEVEGLGWFVELEVVLNEGQTVDEATSIARELVKKLSVEQSDLVKEAYIDLLEEASRRPNKS